MATFPNATTLSAGAITSAAIIPCMLGSIRGEMTLAAMVSALDLGSALRSGSGAPSNGVGVDGDYYLNLTNGDLYYKASNTYSIVGNLKGPAGATGADGAAGSAGSAGPNTVTTSTTTNLTGYLKGNGSTVSASAIDAADLTGTLALARLHTNVALKTVDNAFSVGQSVTTLNASGEISTPSLSAAAIDTGGGNFIVTSEGKVYFVGPTEDPGDEGQLWNEDGFLRISAG